MLVMLKNPVSLIAIIAVATLALLLVPIPWTGMLFSTLQNSGHLLLFFCLAYGGIKIAQRNGWSIYRSVTITFVFLSSLGLLAEALQMNISGRTAELQDLGLNTAGALLGVSTFIIIKYQSLMPTWQTALLSLTCAGILALLLKPALTLLLAHAMRSELPSIINFDDPLSSVFISSVGGAQLTKSRVDHRFRNLVNTSLMVGFTTEQFSGVALKEPPSDWNGFDSFNVAIINHGRETISLNLRINDAEHNNKFTDRYNLKHSVTPGVNFLKIPLTHIHSLGENPSSGNRRMNMAKLTHIEFFTSKLLRPTSLEFLYMRLEK